MIHNPPTYIADIMPPCAEVWITASNAVVKRKGSWAINSGFVVLKPSLLCGVQTSERQQLYLTNWLLYRTPFIASIMDGTGYALSSEQWRNILHLQGKRSENPESKQATAYQILRQCFQNSGLELSLDQQVNNTAVWRNEERSVEALRNPRLGMEVVFELCELNFRYELEALDARSRRTTLTEPLEFTDARDRLRSCFAISNGGPLSAVMLALKKVMELWKGAEQMRDIEFNTVHDISPEIEGKVTRFYAQRFYECFRRVPTLPRYLELV
ncbi:hypothetical protein C8J56DRAFT_879794 [Mycena floridula]|nr:hypothetical protein C8J56DRAFT_879794 [Mycena floridula]